MATKAKRFKGIESAFLVILCCAVVAVCVFIFLLGDPANFTDVNGDGIGDSDLGHPENMLGTIFKGGFIVPVLQTLFLTVIVLSVERAIVLMKAMGKGKTAKFVAAIKEKLANNDIKGAQELCDKQQGCVANVVTSVLVKYEQMENDTRLTKEQKLAVIQQEVEEATALELPALNQNLPIIATLTTLGTLVGLLGTVMGMIKSFSALASDGAADSVALSAGISEALINTAFGIATGALAVISYNFFTSKIDNLTFAIDEIGFSIVGTYAATHEK
ncbi:MAG: MotA/TolQ/ExbB proton channel family protein [Bacteroidales bacterium]|nr:MotA/TolQ/ExbB proton channel family protein [Bacteroidales bacterium]